ncbi:MAG: 4Fe-4S binding protein [Candidatus Omnitrophota bacterium]
MPKTLKKKARIKIKREKCKACGLCVAYCPKGAIVIDEELNSKGVHPAVWKNGECTFCAICALACPECCIELL